MVRCFVEVWHVRYTARHVAAMLRLTLDRCVVLLMTWKCGIVGGW